MKPAKNPVSAPDSTPSGMGSEYMDAQTYLKQPARAARVKQSDPTFHGSNESDFGSTTAVSEID